ncbi:MAG: transposase [Oscillochloris sp.]|nr:transposase [Oscillochloris sp.]
MATEPRVYRYRIFPSEQQEVLFRQYAGARRFVYNHFLARSKTHYRATGKTLSFAALCRELTALKAKPATAWLRAMNGQSLQQAIRDLNRAFTNFFAGRAMFPRFKSKRRERPSFRMPQYLTLDGAVLVVPKIGRVPLVLHRPAQGVLKSGTFRQDPTGAWDVSLVMEVAVVEGPLPPPDATFAVGVDLGLKDLAVLSDGSHIAAPKHYRRAEKKLARLQRRLSRTQKASTNRTKLRAAVARLHHRVASSAARSSIGCPLV